MSGRSRIRRRLRNFAEAGLHEVLPEDVAAPTAWAAVFGRTAPLEVEIGFGKGEFLLKKAAACPDTDFVGIEIDSTRLRWTERKLVLNGVSNVKLVRGDVYLLLPRLFRPGQLSAVYMNFPDPWPKKRHAGRRMIRAAVIDVIIQSIAPGGTMTIVTDVGDYAQQGLELLTARADAVENLCGPGGVVHELAGYPQTIHEWKFRRAGRQIHFLHFQRR